MSVKTLEKALMIGLSAFGAGKGCCVIFEDQSLVSFSTNFLPSTSLTTLPSI